MSLTRSACTLDCPDSCSLEIHTEDGRLTSIRGTRDNPYTAGFICSKVGRFDRHVYHESRVGQPQRRTGPKGEGSFRTISWDEALEEIAERLTQTRDHHGGEAILPLCYGGSNGLLTQNTTDARLFRRLGASQLLRTVCAAPSGAAASGLYGTMSGVALEDHEHADLIVLWGVNPSVSGIHHVPVIRSATRNGAGLVVVDPRRTPLARQADLHVAPRPGTDLPLALAVAHRIHARGEHDVDFLDRHCRNVDDYLERAAEWPLERAAEVCGVPADQIVELADRYVAASPAVIRCGWGPERNRNGGSAVAAILALPALAGKFGVRGGGFTMSNTGPWKRDERLQDVILEPQPPTRAVNMNHTGRALLDDEDPIRFLFVYNCNPLATLPHQNLVRRGLERDDLFTVVFDPVMTDTARFADIVLPATTFVEHEDVARGYGPMVVHRTAPAIAPVGASRPNAAVFGELLQRLGLHREGEPLTEAELRDSMLGDAATEVVEAGILSPPGGARPVLFVDTFPDLEEGRVDLLPAHLDRQAPRGLYRFLDDPGSAEHPLALLSPSTARAVNSILGQTLELETLLDIHPTDAAARDLPARPGASHRVRVFNELGEVVCRYRVTEAVLPGVVSLPKGAWMSSSASGTTSNALVPDTLTDVAGGACFNDARVQVELHPGGGGA